MKASVLCVRIAAVMLLSLLLLTGCSKSFPPPMTYADNGFSVKVRGRMVRTSPDGYDGDPALAGEPYTNKIMDVAATVTVGTQTPDPSDGSLLPGELTVCFTAPAALDGLTVTRTTNAQGQTATSISRGQLSYTATDSSFDGLLLVALALLPHGDVTSVSSTEQNTRTVTLVSDHITRTLTFTDHQTFPSRVYLSHPTGWLDLYVDP